MDNGLAEALAIIEESKRKKREYNTRWMTERRKNWTEEEWEKHRARTKNYSERNRESIVVKNRTRIQEKKDKAIALLGGCCVDCKQMYHRNVYDFHHEGHDEKENILAKMWPLEWTKIEKELNKCVLLCANCHRMRHANAVS